MVYDTIIIGSGPAGLTAGIYSSRDNLKTIVLGGGKWGGQLMLTSTVDNFPGFSEGIMGPDLMEVMKKQAEKFGTELVLQDVVRVDFQSRPFSVWTSESQVMSNEQSSMSNAVGKYQGRSVIVATGADTMWLGLPNEQRLLGQGVSSCAPCDAFFFKGKDVIVVGGGDAAMEEAWTLAKFATNVTIVHRRDAFRASKIMQDRVLSLPNVKVCWNCAVIDVLGKDQVEGVRLKDSLNGQEREMKIDGMFVAIGHTPNTKIFEGQLELDEKGYIRKLPMTNDQLSMNNQVPNSNFQMATSVEGVFVAGDVHDHHYRQAVTAAAYGCMAAMEVSKFLAMG